MRAESGWIWLAGIRFPGNGALVNGSTTCVLRLEKSPARCCALGRKPVVVSALRSLSPSQENSQNTRFRITGPLAVAPYWLRLNGGIGLLAGSKKFFASSSELRRNSYTEAWMALPPLLVE